MIPTNKLSFIRSEIKKNCKDCGGVGCKTCEKQILKITKFANANIPIEYWNLLFKDFNGDPNFKKVIEKKINDIDSVYRSGKSMAFVGKWGVGKTYAACSILKKALLSNFTVKFYTMTEIITSILSKDIETSIFMDEIMTTDFVCIDEYDIRYIHPTERSEQVFGQNMEVILRNRFANQMPTILCSNTPDIGKVMSGTFSDAFESLMSKHVDVYIVGGKDYRKKNQ